MSSKSFFFSLRRYCDFSNFQNGRRRHLGFLKSLNFFGYWGHRVATHQHAKCHQNQSIGCEDIKIFQFFNMAAAAILDCRIRKILLTNSVRRTNSHHCTKFSQNRSFRCADIAIFRIFKMAQPPSGFVLSIFGPPTVSTWGSLSLC